MLAPRFLHPRQYPAERWEPVGVVAWLDAPPADAVIVGLWAAALVAAALFALGRWVRVSGPLAAVTFLLTATVRVSWGHVLHTDHLPALHLCVLGVAFALPRRTRAALHPDVIRVVQLVTVIAYVLAGIAKLRHGGWDWAVGDVLRNQVAHDNVRKALLGDPYSPLGGWLSGVAWVWPPIAVATLVVELAAPVALVGRRIGLWWAATAWAFHVGVLVLMAITFLYPLSGVAYAAFVVVALHEHCCRRIEARCDVRPTVRPTAPASAAGTPGDRTGGFT